jgi:carotenoid cleavage dioxygenase-like enzyme
MAQTAAFLSPATSAHAPAISADIALPLAARAPFRSRAEDGPIALEAEVRGTLPAWLAGDLVRTAPAVFDRVGPEGRVFRAEHWFDALGILFGFRIEEGKVRFRQRLMETEVEAASRTGDMPTASFGSPIVRSFWRRMFSPIPRVTDNTNVNVLPLGDDRVALTESRHQWAFDPETLAVTKRVSYDDALGGIAMTAHAHFDFARGRVVNVATEIGSSSALVVYEHAPNERTRHVVGRVRVGRIPYVHGFGLTPKHAVLVGHPFDVNPLTMLWSNRAFIDHFRYRSELGTKLWLVDRATGSVRTHHAPSGFVFHVLNAFEDAERTVLDVALYPDPSVIDAQRRGSLEKNGFTGLAPSIVRYTMTPGREHAEVQTLLAEGFEFPSVNYRRKNGMRHSFSWGTRIEGTQSTIVKLDAGGGTRVHRDADFLFGEPVFVAEPRSAREDRGVLLVVGAHARDDRSELRVLDARTLDVIAHVEVPLPIPLGFHGSFFAR